MNAQNVPIYTQVLFAFIQWIIPHFIYVPCMMYQIKNKNKKARGREREWVCVCVRESKYNDIDDDNKKYNARNLSQMI